MKAIVLNASPRKNWNTAQLLQIRLYSLDNGLHHFPAKVQIAVGVIMNHASLTVAGQSPGNLVR